MKLTQYISIDHPSSSVEIPLRALESKLDIVQETFFILILLFDIVFRSTKKEDLFIRNALRWIF